jgi:hypothetical protein
MGAILAFRRLFLLLVAAPAVGLSLAAQTQPQETRANVPQIKLEVTPTKKTYRVGETVFVKYKLTSLSDGTLCFPQPGVEAQSHWTGYLTTEAILTRETGDTDGGDRFIENFWERRPTEEQLRSDIANRWIKLGMSEPYIPKKAGNVRILTQPGEWVLQTTYNPPALESQKTLIESLGCSLPDSPVRATPVTITVLPD